MAWPGSGRTTGMTSGQQTTDDKQWCRLRTVRIAEAERVFPFPARTPKNALSCDVSPANSGVWLAGWPLAPAANRLLWANVRSCISDTKLRYHAGSLMARSNLARPASFSPAVQQRAAPLSARQPPPMTLLASAFFESLLQPRLAVEESSMLLITRYA